MKQVLLTGATGFIGRYVLDQLLREGVSVRTLVHQLRLVPPGPVGRVHIVQGDIRNPNVLRSAVEGVDTVLHLAAYARAWAPGPWVFEEVNVRAVDRLLSACAKAGVGRVVHVSSIVALPPHRPAPVDGSCRELTPYEATKMESDLLVRDFVGGGGNAVVVRPTRVFGPGPLTDANGVTRMIDLYLKGRFRVRIDDGDVLANYVHVEDVARGIVLAARRGRRGGDYILGGENISLRGFLERISTLAGVRRRMCAVPPRVGLAVGRLAELSSNLGLTPSLTPQWIRLFLEDRRADLRAARRDLGYSPRTLDEGLASTLEWLGHPMRSWNDDREEPCRTA